MKSNLMIAALLATTSAAFGSPTSVQQYMGNTSFVKNSGICETTPGVNQYSGYFSVAEDVNIWFWYVDMSI